jgi:hypothetical protein
VSKKSKLEFSLQVGLRAAEVSRLSGRVVADSG